MPFGMRSLFVLATLIAACGARTGLRGTGADAGGPACTEPPWIVFDDFSTQGGGIAAMRADGSSFHLLGIDGFLPSVSPDGASLLYVTGSPEGDESLLLRDLASGQTRTIVQLTVQPPSSGLGKAAVSPDGRWIAYGDSPDLRLVAFDGSGDHLLVPGPYEAGCCPWSYGHPQFSADSATVYFSTIGRLASVGVDGSGPTLLWEDQFFSNPTIPGFVFPNASLSPDGKKLVAEVACDVSALRVFDAASLPADPCATGTHLVDVGVSESSNESSNPAWGPTGEIVYQDGADLWAIDAGGGTPKNLTSSLTSNGGAAADPTWAPGCAKLP
jgi:Tol biopolymer transport system component